MKNSEGSLIHQYQKAFSTYGIVAEFTDCGLRELAKQAVSEKTGARALMTILERVLRDFKFELPSSTLNRIKIDKQLVRNPKRQLKVLLGQLS